MDIIDSSGILIRDSTIGECTYGAVWIQSSAEVTFADVEISGNEAWPLIYISEEIDDVLEKGMGDRRMGIEGYNESRWILLDYGDIVVHLFDEETRDYYALEDLWAQAKRVPYP